MNASWRKQASAFVMLFTLLAAVPSFSGEPDENPCGQPADGKSGSSVVLASGPQWDVRFVSPETGPVLYFCQNGELRHTETPKPRSTVLIDSGTRLLKVRLYPRELLVTVWNQGAGGSTIRIYDPLDMDDPLILPPSTSRSDVIRYWEKDGALCFEIFKIAHQDKGEDLPQRNVRCFPEVE